MKIHDKEYNIEELIDEINPRSNLKTNYNGIYLSNEDIEILKKYDFDYQKYTNIKSLILDIEEYLNDSFEELPDLENLSLSLSEFDYYQNTNK